MRTLDFIASDISFLVHHNEPAQTTTISQRHEVSHLVAWKIRLPIAVYIAVHTHQQALQCNATTSAVGWSWATHLIWTTVSMYAMIWAGQQLNTVITCAHASVCENFGLRSLFSTLFCMLLYHRLESLMLHIHLLINSKTHLSCADSDCHQCNLNCVAHIYVHWLWI